MTTKSENTRRINASALQGLSALERTLKRHAHDLTALDCEEIEVAAAIVYALELIEKALEKTRDTKQRICDGKSPVGKQNL